MSELTVVEAEVRESVLRVREYLEECASYRTGTPEWDLIISLQGKARLYAADLDVMVRALGEVLGGGDE